MPHKAQIGIRKIFLFSLAFCLSVLFMNSCKKADILVPETTKEVIEETPQNFFNLPANASPVLKRIAKELERQNKSKEFIAKFIAKEGFPIWGKSRIERQRKNGNIADFDSDGLEDTTVYIPLVVSADNYVTGFLKAIVDDSVRLQIYRQNDYVNFPFKTPTVSTNVTTAENYALRMMTMGRDVFGTTTFLVQDKRMFNNSNDYSDTAENVRTFVTLTDSTSGGGDDDNFANGSTINNYQYEVCWTVERIFRICPAFTGSGGNNTQGCPLYTLSATTCTTWEIGGGGGGSSPGGGNPGGGGGTWPFPPSGPGGGGAPCTEEFGASIANSFIPIECNPGGNNPWPPLHPVVQSIRTILFNGGVNISSVQMDWLITHLSKADQIHTYLEDNGGSPAIAYAHIIKMMQDAAYLEFDDDHATEGDDSKMWWEDNTWLANYGGTNFGGWAIDYISQNPTVSFSVFQNQFMPIREGLDGTYNETYWEDPNLTFPPQTLPSWSSFNAAYPKHSDPLYDTPVEMYTSIGGQVLTQYNTNPPLYQNTCALRLSKALNYSGVTIPSGTDRFQGADGKYYFLSAKALLKWMKKTFGTPTGGNHLTGAQGGAHGQNFPTLLAGKKGIYIMVPNYPGVNYFGASGHADMIEDSVCDGGCNFDAHIGGVSEIFVWELQ